MASVTPTSHSLPQPQPRSGHAKPVTRTVSILSKRKSLWKMVRSLLLPSRLVATFASCGGSGVAARRRRRLERVKRVGGQVPLERRPQPQLAPSVTAITTTGSENENNFANLSSVTEILREISLAEEAEPQIIRNPVEFETLHHPSIVLLHEVPIATRVQVNDGNDEDDQDLQAPPTPTEPPPQPELQPQEPPPPLLPETEEIVVRRRDKKEDRSSGCGDTAEFHGWRKSSIDVNTEPPLTLKWIPSGLQIGDQVLWLSESEPPEKGVVRWIGKIRQQFYAGVEFERSIGNSSGLYGYGGGLVARLFTCDLGFGRFIPIHELVLYSDFHDKGIKAGFICIICRDDFLQLPDAQGEDGHMVATKCGHLYHGTCLHGWFAAKSKQSKVKGEGNQSQPCPHCQSPIQLEDMIRLFPAQV